MLTLADFRNATGNLLRRARLLEPAYRALYFKNRIQHAMSNRRVRAQHPDVVFPPAELLYETSTSTSLDNYWNGGQRRASILYRLLEEVLPEGPVRALDWGCGVARVVRHLPEIGKDRPLVAVGSDYAERTVEWCRHNVPGVEFRLNHVSPPLPFEDDEFDFLYSFSVYTHLSASLQRDWLQENLRVVRPGGVVLLSVHGDAFINRLTAAERSSYSSQGVVERSGVADGSPWFTTYNSPKWMGEVFFHGLEIVSRELNDASVRVKQDVWAVRVP